MKTPICYIILVMHYRKLMLSKSCRRKVSKLLHRCEKDKFSWVKEFTYTIKYKKEYDEYLLKCNYFKLGLYIKNNIKHPIAI